MDGPHAGELERRLAVRLAGAVGDALWQRSPAQVVLGTAEDRRQTMGVLVVLTSVEWVVKDDCLVIADRRLALPVPAVLYALT